MSISWFQFDRWSDAQRRIILEILISKCKNSQLQYTFSLIDERIPITHVDFTRKLPRVITVYIMSFLDPRSLCRCAQVCWFWKYLSELDQIWMPKCFKFGWLLPFVPTPYEQGVWKRHYLECVRGLQYMRPKVKERFSVLHNVLNSGRKHVFNQGFKKLKFQLVLWGSSSHILPPLATSCLSLLMIHLS